MQHVTETIAPTFPPIQEGGTDFTSLLTPLQKTNFNIHKQLFAYQQFLPCETHLTDVPESVNEMSDEPDQIILNKHDGHRIEPDRELHGYRPIIHAVEALLPKNGTSWPPRTMSHTLFSDLHVASITASTAHIYVKGYYKLI